MKAKLSGNAVGPQTAALPPATVGPQTPSGGVLPPAPSWPARALLKLIWIYQHYISSWTPSSCRFYPTCSHYTYQAIERFGAARGVWLGLRRLAKCHPFHKGGFDPVPAQWRAHRHEPHRHEPHRHEPHRHEPPQ
jgi:putative membrane protein insertion efficiency factor